MTFYIDYSMMHLFINFRTFSLSYQATIMTVNLSNEQCPFPGGFMDQ